MAYYKHIWGQGTIDLKMKDLASLKLQRCIDSINLTEGNVLEIGSGAGRFIRSLKKYYPSLNCYGGDLDDDNIEFAKKLNDGVTYTAFNAESMPFEDEMFDAVMLFDVLEHVEKPDDLISEIMRILKKGGKVHFYVPCEKNSFMFYWKLKNKHAGHILRLNADEVIEMMKGSGFDIAKVEYSTYLIGQMIDIFYWSLIDVERFRMPLLMANIEKDTQHKDESIFRKVAKKLINLAYMTSYYESMVFSTSFMAQGLHLTCIKK